MGEAKNRRDRGLAPRPAEERQELRSKLRGKKSGFRARRLVIKGRVFELTRARQKGKSTVYEIIGTQSVRVLDAPTIATIQHEIDWDFALQVDAQFNRARAATAAKVGVVL